jgi:hypothetical protein
MKNSRLILSAVVIGLLAGVLLDVATFLVARYGPQADGWSFRGNGALSVPFGLGPAILAGFWAALVFRFRGFARWLVLGVAAALVGTTFLLASVFVLVLFNSDGVGASNALTFFILGWMVLAPILAAVVPAPKPRPEPQQVGGHIGAGILITVALVVAFSVASFVLAPGS